VVIRAVVVFRFESIDRQLRADAPDPPAAATAHRRPWWRGRALEVRGRRPAVDRESAVIAFAGVLCRHGGAGIERRPGGCVVARRAQKPHFLLPP
jgi:hypothetical protein